ncbi:MAG: SIS domain-containing protein [Liquorilactobacillus hordei]|uniref:SIS domain-containing protein n=1 Tax=Liquorilactobacillus hordei TaxID=468911 RepID=UPI0039E874B9
MIDLKKVEDVVDKLTRIEKICFVGCGASMSDLYPAFQLVKEKGNKISSRIFTANEFNYGVPSNIDNKTLVIIASLGGNTQESVAAIAVAKGKEATVVTITATEGSGLTKGADYVLFHGFHESYAAKTHKMQTALYLVVGVLEKFDGYTDAADFKDGLLRIDDLIIEGVKPLDKVAKKFAESIKNEHLIYVLSSGATYGTAYSTANFLFMEMQWLPAIVMNSGEYFHGPFELTEKNVPYLLFMNEGSTRHLDARVLEFLQRFQAKYYVLDAKDFGIGNVIAKSVVDYFNPLILTGAMRVYAEKLSIARNHPLTSRRYMWKLENY